MNYWSIYLLSISYLDYLLACRGVGTGEAGEAAASLEIRGWKCKKFSKLANLSGILFSCFTGNFTVPTPLNIFEQNSPYLHNIFVPFLEEDPNKHSSSGNSIWNSVKRIQFDFHISSEPSSSTTSPANISLLYVAAFGIGQNI